jgi:hypothetical protein
MGTNQKGEEREICLLNTVTGVLPSIGWVLGATPVNQ